MSFERDTGSFRDPVGQVFKSQKDDFVVRGLNKEFFDLQLRLFSEKFFKDFISSSKVVNSRVLNTNEVPIDIGEWHGFIRHELIENITYPYEWSFDQLKDAALLQLELTYKSIENNWIIKDATSYNIQFKNNKPIFIDTPSFVPYLEGDGWEAYRQFCMLFLYPLLLEGHLGIDFRPLLRSDLDGINPKLMSKIFSGKRIFKKGVISHITLPSLVESNILKKERDTNDVRDRKSIKQSKLRVLALIDSLIRLIKTINSPSNISEWGDYDHNNTYSHQDNELKKAFIHNVATKIQPRLMWDMGANTGLFSEHVQGLCRNIIAMDGDKNAVNQMYQRLSRNNVPNITPIVINLGNMSPNQGFAYKERHSLDARYRPDMIMCLALIHHIRLGANIPLRYFLEYLRSHSCDIVIEFVNREDSMVKKLLANKKEQYLDYDIDSFKTEAKRFFDIVVSEKLKNGNREIFHLTPKQDV